MRTSFWRDLFVGSRLLAVFGVVALHFSGAVNAAEVADLVMTGGRIYTLDPAKPWVTAVAIRARKFIYVGDDAGAKRYLGARTRVIDLGGRMSMPGLHDAHAHLLLSGIQNTVECRLPPHDVAKLPEVIVALKSCEGKLKAGDWLVGGRVSHVQFPDNMQHRRQLDAAFPDRPVLLDDFSLHHVLVNSKALSIAGINRDTPDPPGGRIVKDANGEPTGVLLENATWLARQHVPVHPDRDLAALQWAAHEYSRYGFTSVQEASANRRTLTALRALDGAGRLHLNVAAHLVVGNAAYGQGTDKELLALVERRKKFRSTHVYTDFIKMFVDGVPTAPWYTSVNMDPASGEIDKSKLLTAQDELTALLVRFDSDGLKTKLHIAGDGAAHIAIDAIAAARRANPASKVRHDLGHTTLVARADMDRMAQNNIVAEVSPALWPMIDKVGNPPRRAWEFRSLQSRNVLITMGTDWVVTPSPSLFVGLQGMLQRGDESLSLPEALRTMTINGAISVGWEHRQGSIQSGKTANLIVLDQNLFEVPVQQIGSTNVLLTLFEGQQVYSNSPELSPTTVARRQ